MEQGETCSLRLRHIIATRKWCFKEGADVVSVGGAKKFFDTRAEAVSILDPRFVLDRAGCVAEKPAWVR